LFLDADANYHSIFFRRKFTVADPASVKWLVLRLNYNDGFVAYLNGQEIARSGLSNATVQFDDFAASHPDGAAEEFDVSSAAGLLSAGENLLAIELHNAVTNEIGGPNTMILEPELLANFQRGPFIQNATTSSVQVIWRTPVAADGVVEFGTNQDLGLQTTESILTTNHMVTLTNLQAGAQYYYRIHSTTGLVSAVSAISSFRALKSSGDLSFLVVADTGNGSTSQFRVADEMAAVGGDLVMHCGDVVYPDFTYGLEDMRCLSVYGQQMRSMPFFFVMGNHEVQNGLLGTAYLDTFYLPTNSVFGTEHFYSFDHGDAHFVSLFAPWLQDPPGMDAYKLYEGSAQYMWLTNDLASSTKPWKFIFLHHPLATSGSHRSDHNNGTALFDWEIYQSLLIPVARRYGAQVVFSGHDHDYERLNPIQGVQLIVDGGGSSDLHGIEERDGASSQFYAIPSFSKVTIHGDTLLLQTYGTNGAVIDYMSLQRAQPPPQVYEAAWHSPLVESVAANDGHGNIVGQTFDFIGTPIPTLPGESSNLGRVFVNNDGTNLFIGFDQAMFYSNHNVLLFIEPPSQSGVSNLIGLGDGLADTVEGVNGLDFLENLAFTNFVPTIGCVLGDEYADGQFRGFNRPGQALSLGQGVFRLDAGFSNVPGIRVQQFNRSPQVHGFEDDRNPTEQNANYIEVAIPYSELGGLLPGDTIKIAAVVGLGSVDTNAQTIALDTSFLGSSMTGSGQSNVLLGSLSIHLSPAPLIVKADDLARAYGATNPPLTLSYTGFINGEDVNALNGNAVLSTTADTNSPIGTYPISLSAGTLSNAHYTLIFTPGNLTVTQAVLTAMADNQTRIYGATNPVFTGNLQGIQNNDILVASYSTVATPTSAIGPYPIVPSVSGSYLSNYSVVTNFGTLTVSPAPLSVTANNATRTYGAADPSFSGVIVGIQNNDSISANYSTLATAASPIGSYPIVPALSGAMLPNYSVTTNTGTLAVTAATLTAKADDQTRAYGRTNGPLRASFTGFVNGQDTNILNGSPILTTVAETNSPVGTYPITLAQGNLSVANTNYNLILSNGTLTVIPAELSVKADDKSRIYGQTNPPLTFGYSGFVNGQGTNILSGSPALTTVAATNSPAGIYSITVNLGDLAVSDTNYSLVLSNGTLTVGQAALTVTVEDRIRTYGATNPVFNGSIAGLVNGDTLTATYTTVAVPTSPVGNYAIVPALSGASLPNYSVTTNLGTLTIRRAPLSVTASNATRAYGAADPAFTGVIVGIQNNEGITANYSTAATAASPIGTYPIVPSLLGGTLANYNISTNNGSLMVTAATLTAKAVDQTRTYGATNGPLQVSFTGFVNGQSTNILSGSPVLSTTAETNSPVGSYPITLALGSLSVANTNYNLVLSNGTLTVTPASLSVRADDKSRVYAQTNPPLTFTISGFVNGQDTNILSGNPVLSTLAQTNSPVGIYAITVSPGNLAGADTNYNLVLTNGALTITNASSTCLLISSQNPSTNGDAVTFTATVSPLPPLGLSPTGSVTFTANGTTLGTSPLSSGTAILNTTLLPSGTNTVAAEYAGDGNFLGSTNSLDQVVVNQCSSTNFILSIVMNETNTFTMTFLGTSKAQYRVLSSTNLDLPVTAWSVVPGSTNRAVNGIWRQTVTNAAGASQYFRAQALIPCQD
jgi:hypothetical protein